MINTRTGGKKTQKICPQYRDEFYDRLTADQKKEALEKGRELIEGLLKDHPQRDQIALNEFFLAHTGQG